MKYLLLTILVSSFIYVIFKMFSKYEVKTFQAIVVNYLVCAVIGFFLSGFDSMTVLLGNVKPALPYAVCLSLLFITVFTFIGLTSQKFGISVTSLADRISLIIPVFFAFILFGDQVTILKVIGIIFSIIAVVFAVAKKDEHHEHLAGIWYYPLIVFIGGGMVGTLLNMVQEYFPDLNYSGFLVTSFGIAFIIGLSILLFQAATKRTKIDGKSLFAGILLGIPNYFSLYWFLKALAVPNWESSIIFPINNIGVLVITAIVGVLLFQEKLSNKNKLGLGLAILAIAVLIFETLNG